MDMEKIARWAFIIFVILAFVMGSALGYMSWAGYGEAAKYEAYVTLILVILGVIVGFVSITTKEVMPFLIATIALVAAGNAAIWGSLQYIPEVGPFLRVWVITTLNFIAAFAAPGAVIGAVKSVFAMAREK